MRYLIINRKLDFLRVDKNKLYFVRGRMVKYRKYDRVCKNRLT